MVAKLDIHDRFVEPPAAVLEGRWRLALFTHAEAMEMVRMGLIPEDASTELISGMVVLTDRSALEQDPTMIGQNHAVSVERLSDLRTRLNSATRHVRSQQPLFCAETHVPQPDFMVLRGTLADYSDLPTAADAWCVIEVADSSYERDTTEKLRGYARAGVGQYVIVNLRSRTAEVYESPKPQDSAYGERVVLSAAETLAIRVGEKSERFSLPLSEILPPTGS